MADLRAAAASLVEVADELERLRRQVRELGNELAHERHAAQRATKERNGYEHELRRVQHVLLQEGATPDQMETEGTSVVLVQILDHAQRAIRQ